MVRRWYVVQMRCCGAESSYDWVTSQWANETGPHPLYRRQSYLFLVPDSCCFDRSADAHSITAATTRKMAPVCRNVRLTPADNVTSFTVVHMYNNN